MRENFPDVTSAGYPSLLLNFAYDLCRGIKDDPSQGIGSLICPKQINEQYIRESQRALGQLITDTQFQLRESSGVLFF
jgi:hypothetical protein